MNEKTTGNSIYPLKVAVIVNDGMVAGIELEDESEYLN